MLNDRTCEFRGNRSHKCIIANYLFPAQPGQVVPSIKGLDSWCTTSACLLWGALCWNKLSRGRSTTRRATIKGAMFRLSWWARANGWKDVTTAQDPKYRNYVIKCIVACRNPTRWRSDFVSSHLCSDMWSLDRYFCDHTNILPSITWVCGRWRSSIAWRPCCLRLVRAVLL